MSRLFYHVMQDNTGNLLFDVSGTMRLAGSGTLATIYGDEALTVILPNPMTNHPSFASFKCFLGAGDYDFYMAKSGYTFETLTGVQGHGTMAQQNANAVTITGGTVGGLTSLSTVGAASPAYFMGPVTAEQGIVMFGKMKVGTAGPQAAALDVYWDRDTENALTTRPTNDIGAFYPLGFLNASGIQIGSITQTASAVAYNTTSDGRLKEALRPLTGALDTLMRLLPRTFRWARTGEVGHGFVAEEVAQVLPGVTTGTPGAVHADGSIDPMQMDHSKLMPWVVAALQEVVQRLEAIEARLA